MLVKGYVRGGGTTFIRFWSDGLKATDIGKEGPRRIIGGGWWGY